MTGKINFTQCQDTSGKKPHFKGFITIGSEVHEFAVWPAKNGNGWSGTHKPKSLQLPPETERQLDELKASANEAEIPF
jgi:hypothetical protein